MNGTDDADDDDDDADDSLWNLAVWTVGTMTDKNYDDMDSSVDLR